MNIVEKLDLAIKSKESEQQKDFIPFHIRVEYSKNRLI